MWPSLRLASDRSRAARATTASISSMRSVASAAASALDWSSCSTTSSEVDRVPEGRTWTLIGADGKPYQSERPGSLGGHRARKLYGLFNCPSALQAIARGGYVKNRVFFRDEATAVAAGYRPCAVCLPEVFRPKEISAPQQTRRGESFVG